VRGFRDLGPRHGGHIEDHPAGRRDHGRAPFGTARTWWAGPARHPHRTRHATTRWRSSRSAAAHVHAQPGEVGMTSGIRGIAAYFPDRVRKNDEWPEEFAQRLAQAGDRLFNDIPEAEDAAGRVTSRFLREEAQ